MLLGPRSIRGEGSERFSRAVVKFVGSADVVAYFSPTTTAFQTAFPFFKSDVVDRVVGRLSDGLFVEPSGEELFFEVVRHEISSELEDFLFR